MGSVLVKVMSSSVGQINTQLEEQKGHLKGLEIILFFLELSQPNVKPGHLLRQQSASDS